MVKFMDDIKHEILTDELEATLAPLWQAVDCLEANWREKILAQTVDEAADLLRQATDMAVAVIQNPGGDIDDARGALANQLKTLLEDPRFVRLRPSVAFVQSGTETILTGLVLPEMIQVSLDGALIFLQPGDAIDDRIYKLWRRFARQIEIVPQRVVNVLRRWRKQPEREFQSLLRTVRVASIGKTYLQIGLPLEAALVHGFEISALMVQALRRLWEVFLREYTALDEREADCQALENVCEEALSVLVTQGELAEREIESRFGDLRSTLQDLLGRIEAPWEVYIRAIKLYFGNLRLRKQYQNLEADWERLYRGMLGSFDLGLEIASFQYQATEYAEKVREIVSDHVESSLLVPLAWMRDRCEADAQEVRNFFSDLKNKMEDQEAWTFARSVDDLQDQLEKLVTSLSTGYTVHTMSQIDRGCMVAQGRGELALMSDASEQLMRQVGGDCDFWVGESPQWAMGELPPDAEILQVPVRELVRPLMDSDVQPGLDELRQRLVDLFLSTQNTLRDVWKVIRFNVESGIGEMDGETTDRRHLLNTAEEIAVGGLERAGARVGELIAEVEHVAKEVDAGVQGVLNETLDKVEKSLQPGSELDVRLRKFTRLARLRAEGYAEIGEGVGAAFQARWNRLRLFATAMGSALVARLRRVLGIAPVAQQEAQATIDEADLGTVDLNRLPPIYRRLFRLEALQTDDFLVARNDELDTMRQALVRWENKRSCALALVGEVGTGKTSLLNCAEPKLFRRHQVFRHAFEETVNNEADLVRTLCSIIGINKASSLDDVTRYFADREEPCVIILEHGYELFIRRIGGLEVIRAFLQLISATSQKVFWCLSMTESAWRYLDAVVQISEYFSYMIETRNMPADELEQAVMARHEVSGYGLRFLPGDSPSVARRLKKAKDEDAQQDILHEVYFDHLSDASKGNVQIALFYWLRSILEVKEDTVFVEALKPLRFAFLASLSADKLFTLAAMLQHGTLTVSEHKEIFRSAQAISQGVLDTLAASNIIQIRPGAIDKGELRYAINPVMRRPVVDLLWNRHILY